MPEDTSWMHDPYNLIVCAVVGASLAVHAPLSSTMVNEQVERCSSITALTP